MCIAILFYGSSKKSNISIKFSFKSQTPRSRILQNVLATDQYRVAAEAILQRGVQRWDRHQDAGAQMLAITEEVLEAYDAAEKAWTRKHGLRHRQAVRELQQLQWRLGAGQPEATAEYRAAVNKHVDIMQKEVFQAGTGRLNTCNRHLRGKAFWNQNRTHC